MTVRTIVCRKGFRARSPRLKAANPCATTTICPRDAQVPNLANAAAADGMCAPNPAAHSSIPFKATIEGKAGDEFFSPDAEAAQADHDNGPPPLEDDSDVNSDVEGQAAPQPA